MSEIKQAIIKCSICGGERFLSVPEYKKLVEGNILKICNSCEDKAKSINLPIHQPREPHSELLTYINSVRGVKDEH